ncbi:hypothetical protein Mpe_B0626 (plasmid) [Methylibium petroleiphilum PM1]|uniref:Uncharacterized protein n=1 Tax=Methylibium petroleiphilum (strain ATCC BAA-1232 / LMG 22953 / PM1) TaxID=420662 RepID=A2SPA1_METPP|nr:hypothetical protein Mpe_B0626 [Methylibium petroleiphilum PM1]
MKLPLPTRHAVRAVELLDGATAADCKAEGYVRPMRTKRACSGIKTPRRDRGLMVQRPYKSPRPRYAFVAWAASGLTSQRRICHATA